MAQLTPFDLGQIKAHVYHGMSGAAISRILRKPDGKSFWSEQAIQDAITKVLSRASVEASLGWQLSRLSESFTPTCRKTKTKKHMFIVQ